ncbi:uncharacterized protein LOC119663870 [Teleopsis dalmanni]|uniref:uncharacterized protein LOC119663870 n=1 Tax=Teleopsis dalmanni TaxID=139649 RepID=UPI0018CD92A4|nr:uncharacterized protein LOC119663870 [Teleopsis dalmanni]
MSKESRAIHIAPRATELKVNQQPEQRFSDAFDATTIADHFGSTTSDNATNFIGAKNHLAELEESIYSNEGQEAIISACSTTGINFHFIPPRAPHLGGLWEASVKSAKYLLLRSVSTASLTYEELETVVVKIEAILNSRPLTPMSNDPTDLTALTPGHLLIGEALTTL